MNILTFETSTIDMKILKENVYEIYKQTLYN